MNSRVASVLLICCLISPTFAQWPQFLGPNRGGIAPSSNIADSFPDDGPRELWRVDLGVSMSGLAVAEQRAYTMFQDTQSQYAVALDMKTGDTLWKTPVSKAYKNGQGDGPRSTPTVTKSTVVVFTGDGVLAALDKSTGQVRWSQELMSSLGGRVADYGMSCSPLLVGNLVVVSIGVPGAAVVAVDQESGKIVWRSGNGPAGYSSPALLDVSGKPTIVAFLGDRAAGFAPKTGKLMWEYSFPTDYQCNTATPIAVDGRVLISAGENQGSVLLKIEQTGENYAAKEVWTSLGPRSAMRSEWQTPILHEGYLYGFDNVGSAGAVTHLVCVDSKTGKQMWRVPRFGKGNAIASGDKWVMSTMAGELIIAQMNPERFVELARAQVIGKTRQAPVIAGTKLLLRDNAKVVCFELAD